jgi:raffinose/stachyose/melibiose transport system permease protein
MTALSPSAPQLAATGTEDATDTLPAQRAPSAAKMRRSRGDRMQTSHLLFALPALAFFAVFALLPLEGVLVLSFTSWNGIGAIEFTGLTSWTEALTRSTTWQGLGLVVIMIVATWLLHRN